MLVWGGLFLWNFRDPDEMIIKWEGYQNTQPQDVQKNTQVSVEFSKKNSVELEVPKMFLGEADTGSFLGK